MKQVIIDIHCDLLSYLIKPNTNSHDTEAIGCAVPYLKEGNVKLQVMAIFAPTQPESHKLGIAQSQLFNRLATQNNEWYLFEKTHLETLHDQQHIGMLAAIENASAFCDEHMTLQKGFEHLKAIREHVNNLFYIGLTHHYENRFGGGNYTNVGLKKDGKTLIEHIDNQKIAIDLSHASDALADAILTYISKNNLNVPIIASHSNYRTIFNHPRNLPDTIAQEIIHQKGLIGINFLRAFVDNDTPETLQKHIAYGIELGAKNVMCYGADYFHHKDHPDTSRIPFFFPEYENARCYLAINKTLESRFNTTICNNISHNNVINFLKQLWH